MVDPCSQIVRLLSNAESQFNEFKNDMNDDITVDNIIEHLTNSFMTSHTFTSIIDILNCYCLTEVIIKRYFAVRMHLLGRSMSKKFANHTLYK